MSGILTDGVIGVCLFWPLTDAEHLASTILLVRSVIFNTTGYCPGEVKVLVAVLFVPLA